MRELTIDEIKEIQLNMLIDFAAFCDRNNITYYLAGGTLLGAVRHQGFIPWDDDIDLMMPRKDFDRAISKYNHNFYKLNYVTNNEEHYEQIAKLCDTRTYLFNDSYRNTEINSINFVAIDICPIDGLPNNVVKQKALFFVVGILNAIHSATVLSIKPTKRYQDSHAGLLNWKLHLRNIAKYIMIGIFGRTKPQYWVKVLNEIVTKEDFYNHNYVAALVSCIHESKEKMPSHIYEPKKLLEFEGHKFWGLADNDYYLSHLYGDYMKLPSEDKRVSHHDLKAYWK